MILAQANRQTIQRIFEAFGRGDLATILSALSPDVEWQVNGPPAIRYTGHRHGLQQVGQFFAALAESVEVKWFEPRDVVAQDDDVIVFGLERLRVKSTGREVEDEWVMRFTLRDGQVTSFREYLDTAAVAAAFQHA